jgi:lipoprotein-anchoring transpeptidase ErfK/SrfK
MRTLASRLRPLVLAALSVFLAGCGAVAPLVPGVLAPATPAPPGPGVAGTLADPPAPGESVELDAYYSGAWALARGGGPVGPVNQAGCPDAWSAALSDRPFAAELWLLNGSVTNVLPEDAAWLVAVAPEGLQIPYHARLRGRLGDPAYAACPNAARVFVVEEVVRVYEAAPADAWLGQPPEGYAGWPRHREAALGYSLPFPPDWQIERLSDGTLVLTSPQWPSYPVAVRVHMGETHADPYDPAAAPPLLRGQVWSAYQQGHAFPLTPDRPAETCLAGYRVERDEAPRLRTTSLLFNGHGRTYELSVRYPLGLDAPQALLTAYTAIVEGFSLDVAPGPSPTPPVRQALGPGPFLSEEEALAAVRARYGEAVELLFPELVSEAAARAQAGDCRMYAGHSDGVWLLAVRVTTEGGARTLRVYLDATTGRELCAEEIDPSTLPTPTPTPTPLPTATPTPQPTPTQAPTPSPATGPEAERWIEVILSEQALIAWQGETAVRRMIVSTGTAQTPTVTGRYSVYLKMVSTRMTGPGYDLPNVPYVLFFYAGYAIHGTYWHTNFGTPMSHGCVNLKSEDAAWLFEWAGPRLPEGARAVYASEDNPGTLVVVRW